MKSITPWLWFDTEAEQAAELYTSLLPDSKITGITRYGAAGPRPEGDVMTVSFELGGRPYMALNGGPQYRFTEAFSVQVLCDSQEEVDRYWDALTDGGEEGRCGWLKDRYGLSWQIVPTALQGLLGDPDPGRSQRALEAMFGMKRLVIAELERAADVTSPGGAGAAT